MKRKLPLFQKDFPTIYLPRLQSLFFLGRHRCTGFLNKFFVFLYNFYNFIFNFHPWGLPRYLSGKNLPAMQEMQDTWVRSLSQEYPLEEGKVTHSSVLAWRIQCTEKAGRLQSMGLQSQTTNLAHMHAFILKQHGWICPPFGLPINGSSFVILLLYVCKIPNSHLDCVWAIMNRDSMKSYKYQCLSGLCSSGLLICIPIPYCFNYYSFVWILLSGEQVLPSYLFSSKSLCLFLTFTFLYQFYKKLIKF